MARPIVFRDPKRLASLKGFSTRDMPAGWPNSRMGQFSPDPPRSTGNLPTPDFIPSDLFTLEPDPNNPDNPKSVKPARISGGKVTRFLKYPDGTDSPVPLFSTDQQGVDPRFGFVTPICRDFDTVSREMPDGTKIDFWGFFDPKIKDNRFKFPSDTIRIVEGQFFHGWLSQIAKKAHTIHWHGIEPTAQNDGVGKLSMEVGGDYIFQWKAGEGGAGTYFYHCHRNTVLHFEIGMYGMLLIDPLSPKGDPLLPPYKTGGPGYVRYKSGVLRYDVEAIWVPDDVDSRFHKVDHGFGLGSNSSSELDAQGKPLGQQFTSLKDNSGPDGMKGLHDFKADHFFITGVPHPWTLNEPTDRQRPGVAAVVAPGQTLLIRLLSADYDVTRIVFTDFDVEVIGVDGRVLGNGGWSRYSSPFVARAGEGIRLTTARRADLLVRPTAKHLGTHTIRIQFLNHITQQEEGIAETRIIVREPAASERQV
ncbi:MAG: multicopper oxidase domain-containing protein [Chloroflexi bacterium]|nr:multicopper oxidase domain-containing protein [Chloroflexota bacterium]